MDEKESLLATPSEGSGQSSGDAVAEKPSVEEPENPDAPTVHRPEAGDSEVKTDSENKSELEAEPSVSELQNHVDQIENSSVSDSDVKKDVTEEMDTDHVDSKETENNDDDKKPEHSLLEESQPDQSETQESKPDEIEHNQSQVTPLDTQNAPKEEFPVETSSQDVTSQESASREDSQEAANDDDVEKKDDEVGKPEFETAPHVALDESQEDHTQALDPFDALLKDMNDSGQVTETAEKSQSVASVNIDDDDDDHNVDGDVSHVEHEDEAGI